MVKVGGRTYAPKIRKNCLTCQSHYRIEIENLILNGYGYEHVAREVGDAGLTARNIGEHVRRGHLPIDQIIRREIIEDRAKEVGKSIESDAYLSDHITVARLGIARYSRYMNETDAIPSEQMVLGMMKLLATVEAKAAEENVDRATLVEGFMVFMETARSIMSTEQFQAFGMRLNTNPVLASLLGRTQKPIDVQAAEPEGEEPQ